MGLRAKSRFPVALAAGFVFLVGCEKEQDQVKVYRVVKAPLDQVTSTLDPSSGISPPAGHPPVAVPNVPADPKTGSALPGIDPSVASVPSKWEAQPPSQMRQASYLVHGENGAVADISLVTLGPASGNVLENVNRWLGQLGQPPITDEQLPQTVEHLPSELGHVAVVDLQGKPELGDPTKDGRILAAIAPVGNGTLFFKMRGNVELVGTEKENFLKWVGSFKK